MTALVLDVNRRGLVPIHEIPTVVAEPGLARAAGRGDSGRLMDAAAQAHVVQS